MGEEKVIASMTKKKNSSIFIKCECSGEGLGVDYYEDDGVYYFSYWKSGISNQKLSWKERFRHCWNVLIKGKAFNDEVILTKDKANELVDFLLGYKRIPKERMDILMEALRAAFKKKK